MKHLLNSMSEEEKNSIREQHRDKLKVVTENFSKLMNSKSGNVKLYPSTLNETEGELNNPNWSKIKSGLESVGFKFREYNEKGEFMNYLYSGKNPFKDYQHGTLEKNGVEVKYPYTEVEGGPIESDKIRIYSNRQGNPQLIQSLKQKYKNSIVYPQESLPDYVNFILKVQDVNNVINLAKDLTSMK